MDEEVPTSEEKFPTEGEVIRMMERLLEEVEFSEIKRMTEGEVLTRLVFEGVDSEGCRILCDYIKTPEGSPTIDLILHNEEGIPCGGNCAAVYINSAWKVEF